jgi:hypothetical protein
MFKNVGDLKLESEFNEREKQPFRHLPARGTFKEIESGAGNKTFKQDRRGIWLGAQKMEEAPFSVSMEGIFKLLSKLSGGVGMSGDEGLWMGAENFEDASFSVSPEGVFKIQGSGTGNKFIGIDVEKGIWLGAEDFDDAPFSVDMDGNMKMRAGSVAGGTSLEWYDSEGNLVISIGL